MDELYDKSELNFSASELLQNNNLYDSVCHPAYYSCLQLMSYKLTRKGYDLQKQASITSSEYNGHSHKYLIDETANIIKFDSYNDERLYKKYIKALKNFRELSDYKNERISKEESSQCISMARQIIQYLKSI